MPPAGSATGASHSGASVLTLIYDLSRVNLLLIKNPYHSKTNIEQCSYQNPAFLSSLLSSRQQDGKREPAPIQFNQ